MSKGGTSSGVKWKYIIIPIIITAIATLIVTIAAPIVIDYFKTPDFKLQYYVQDTLPFKTQTTEIASYQVMVKNEGAKVLEDIVCQIHIPGATINQSNFLSEFPLDFSQNCTANSLTLKIANLNPQETGTIYILATSENQLPTQPNIQLRAKGASGAKAPSTDNQEASPWYYNLATVGIPLTVGLASVILLLKRELKPEPDHKKIEENQNQCLGYLCGVHELFPEMERYYNTSTKSSYRSESDRLTALAVKDPRNRKKILQVLISLLEYDGNIAEESKAVIHYNIAKIFKADRNSVEEKAHLEEAKKMAPEIIESRLKVDPYFKQTQTT